MTTPTPAPNPNPPPSDPFGTIADVLSTVNNDLVQVFSDSKNLSKDDNNTVQTYEKDFTAVLQYIQVVAPVALKAAIKAGGTKFEKDQIDQLNGQIQEILQLLKDIVQYTITHADVVRQNQAFLNFILSNFVALSEAILIIGALLISAFPDPTATAGVLIKVIVNLNRIQIEFGPHDRSAN